MIKKIIIITLLTFVSINAQSQLLTMFAGGGKETATPTTYTQLGEGVLIEGFENIADWTLSNLHAGTTTASTASTTTQGDSSLRVAVTEGRGYAIKSLGNVDLSSYESFTIDVYNPDSLLTLRIGFALSDDDPFNTEDGVDPAIGNRMNKGWNRYAFSKADFTPSIDWSTVKSMRVRCSNFARSATNITYDNFRGYNPKQKAVCLLTFDDNYISVDTIAAPIMDSLGIVGTIFTIGRYANGTIGSPSYLQYAELDERYASGWDIANHGYTSVNWTTLSIPAMIADIEDNRDTLIAHGYTRSSDFAAYPNGAFNRDILDQIKINHKMGRSVRTQMSEGHPIDADDDYFLLNTIDGNTGGNLATLEGYVDAQIASGGVIIFMFHELESYSGKFNSLMIYISEKQDAGGITIMPISEYYNSLQSTFGDDIITVE